jgi:hypothetical protein
MVRYLADCSKLLYSQYFVEVMRSEYKEFLRKAREVLIVLQNSSKQSGGNEFIPTSFAIKEVSKDPTASLVAALNSQRKDIILGMAQDIDPKNFAVFCFSLRKYAFVYRLYWLYLSFISDTPPRIQLSLLIALFRRFYRKSLKRAKLL